MTGNHKNINPNFRRTPAPQYTHAEIVEGVKNRDAKILGHIISKAESTIDKDQDLVYEVLDQIAIEQRSSIIAVSGSPGVGKSTFINSFGNHLVQQGKSIAVLPVDPTSQVSKGSILGDKTRMDDLVKLKGAFIKPMSSSLSLGGVAPATLLASMICEKAGFDYILIETVGVGQSEFEARFMCDCFMLLLQPGGGDDLQGIKRGIMEMADLLVVNKADGGLLDKARNSLQSYKAALKLLLPNSMGWRAKAYLYSSIEHQGQLELFEALSDYFEYLNQHNRWSVLRRDQSIYLFEKYTNDIMHQTLLQNQGLKKDYNDLIDALQEGSISINKALTRFKEKLQDELS
ncbi:MAG: methylmalonyl Co-A mutase-associated GTPase MeaB [Saprospiraceae bacterium]|nr:methylmalonyl Co-A mutase-associated GTPase MeaB [Saprospiraceae bacterium]